MVLRVLLFMAAGLSAIALALAAVLWFAYRDFESDVGHAEHRLSADVRESFADASQTSQPTTILVAAPGGGLQGAVLLRLAPRDHTGTTLELPAGLTLGPRHVGSFIQSRDVVGVVDALGALGIHVDHVLLLDEAKLGDMVDALGGISIINPSASTLETSLGTVSLPAGTTKVDGSMALALAHALPAPGTAATADPATLVLAAVGRAVFEPTSVPAVRQAGQTLGRYAATDLAGKGVFTSIRAWADAHTSVACSAPASGLLDPGMVQAFAGQGGASSGCTAVESRAPASVRALALLGVDPGASLALILGLGMLALGLSLTGLIVSSPSFAALVGRDRYSPPRDRFADDPRVPVPTSPAMSTPARGAPMPGSVEGDEPAASVHSPTLTISTPVARAAPAESPRRSSRSAASRSRFSRSRRVATLASHIGEGLRRGVTPARGRPPVVGYAALLGIAVGAGFIVASLLAR